MPGPHARGGRAFRLRPGAAAGSVAGMTAAPLAGIRVLDLTNVLAGPFACQQMAHLGADVIKVEAPGGGDLARALGADEGLAARGMGVSFLAANAGKRSVTVNLKHPRGAEVLRALVRGADVLVENFRPGVMDRLGVGAEALRAERPELIYCAISGFGQDGPLAHAPAYDQIVQGMAGAMDVTGDPDGPPTRAGWPVADTVGGLTAAMAVCAALNARPRGCTIDVSMLDSLLATMGWAVSNLLVAGVPPARAGNENPTSAPSAAYRTADGLLNVAANREEQWRALAGELRLGALREDPRFTTRAARRENRLALGALIEERLAARTARDWAERLPRIGVPAGEVLSVAEALAHPQVAGRGQVAEYELTCGRRVRAFRTGLRIDGAAPGASAPPPELGAQADAILAEAGYGAGAVAALRAEGAL